MENCVCITCRNIHCTYNTLTKCLKNPLELPKSPSEYLCKNITCAKGWLVIMPLIAFWVCDNKWEITDIKHELKEYLPECVKKVSYYVFEIKTSSFFDTHRKEKSYTCTT